MMKYNIIDYLKETTDLNYVLRFSDEDEIYADIIINEDDTKKVKELLEEFKEKIRIERDKLDSGSYNIDEFLEYLEEKGIIFIVLSCGIDEHIYF